MELSHGQLNHIMKRFPDFELSYETISHKKVSTNYNICLAIPTGKKVIAWFTFHNDKDVCYIFDLSKDKKISKGTQIDLSFNFELSYGTILYGTLLTDEKTGNNWFILEDIIYFKGTSTKKTRVLEKIDYMNQIVELITKVRIKEQDILFYLPMMWEVSLRQDDNEYPSTIPPEISRAFSYSIHHIQYRAVYETMPYLNVFLNRKIYSKTEDQTKKTTPSFDMTYHRMDFSKPQYRNTAIFQVSADIQFDIYHLFAYGKNKMPVYYNVAYVPNYKSSVFLNGLFRNIRENKNLDYIEESDDEDDFQNIEPSKYVDVNKTLLMECTFNHKFKRWTPLRVVDRRNKVVHITQL
jgi:hypothetical protein